MQHDPTITSEDRHRLEHMRQAARDAIAILGDLNEQTLGKDMIRARALVNCFTEIGEAAARTTEPARALAAHVPWKQIVGMRHNLIHVYWGIDYGELIKTVRSDLVPFIAALDQVLALK